MPNELDVNRLIALVHLRPSLWDVRLPEYKDRINTPLLWTEISELLQIDVEHCKRKWKNLRDAYRAEVRRTERRMERLKALGQLDTNRRITSKWVYFEPMSFINETKRTSSTARNVVACPALPEDPPSSNGSPEELSPHEHVYGYEPDFRPFCDIKMEAHHTTTDDDDEDDDKLFEEFNAVATTQAARRLSEEFAANVAAAAGFDSSDHSPFAALPGNGADLEAAQRCRCDKRKDEQVHFLEDLEREEQKLMQSTRKEIRRDNSNDHVGDADYNFLVSFLPQMKKMSELQNLLFRSKMSDLLLHTMATPSAAIGHVASQRPFHPFIHHQEYPQSRPLNTPQLQQPPKALQLQSAAGAGAELMPTASAADGVQPMATEAATEALMNVDDGGVPKAEKSELEQMIQDTAMSGNGNATPVGLCDDNDFTDWN